MKLLGDERLALLSEIPLWAEVADRDAITRTYDFRDFAEAFAFMTRIALHAEKTDHHPEWRNVYKRVEVVLTTHEAGGITERDIALARLMDEAAGLS
jgi:4a-hydroxytetrahydrobiopterin dehydratase